MSERRHAKAYEVKATAEGTVLNLMKEVKGIRPNALKVVSSSTFVSAQN